MIMNVYNLVMIPSSIHDSEKENIKSLIRGVICQTKELLVHWCPWWCLKEDEQSSILMDTGSRFNLPSTSGPPKGASARSSNPVGWWKLGMLVITGIGSQTKTKGTCIKCQ
jgi:hypothetical protein